MGRHPRLRLSPELGPRFRRGRGRGARRGERDQDHARVQDQGRMARRAPRPRGVLSPCC